MVEKPGLDLGELLGPGAWHVTRAARGASARSWIASHRDQRRFVKAGVDLRLAVRLGELGVAPSVVASRTTSSGDLVAFEYADGAHPDPRWVDEHVAVVAGVMARYHADVAARAPVAVLTAAAAVDAVQERLASLPVEERPGRHSPLSAAVERIAAAASAVEVADGVLTHGDPNTSNLIVTGDGTLVLVDWDEARLSDPLRDLGQLLWWYVRPERWADGLGACGLADDAGVRQRLQLWAAAESAEVAVGLLERGERAAAGAFALDALAAAAGRANPRGWWVTDTA